MNHILEILFRGYYLYAFQVVVQLAVVELDESIISLMFV